MENTNQYYTVEEVGTLLKVTSESVRRWVRSGQLKAVKLGGKYIRIAGQDLDTFLKNQRA